MSDPTTPPRRSTRGRYGIASELGEIGSLAVVRVESFLTECFNTGTGGFR